MRAQSMQRVVVIFPGALGDLLLALPALRALRARHASAHLTLVVNGWLGELAGLAHVADDTATLDAADAAGLFGGETLPAWLDGRPLVYSWLGASDDGMRARLVAAGAGVRLLRVERGPGTVHAAVAYARAVGAPAGKRTLAAAAALAAPWCERAAALVQGLREPVLVIHPGAGSRSKRWDVAGFVQVAHRWNAAGGSVVVLMGPAEAGEPPMAVGLEVREWPLLDLAALLAQTALFLGNDSGIAHLAGAVGGAGVVLFGPTEPERWRPLAGRLAALRARASETQGITLSALPAARVVAACRRALRLDKGNPRD